MSVDLSAPLELSDTRTVLADGQALQLYVDNRCGDVVGFASVLCTGKHLQTTFGPISSHTFWVNITGLENHQHCVMIKATTDREINSSHAIFDLTHLRGQNRFSSKHPKFDWFFRFWRWDEYFYSCLGCRIADLSHCYYASSSL